MEIVPNPITRKKKKKKKNRVAGRGFGVLDGRKSCVIFSLTNPWML